MRLLHFTDTHLHSDTGRRIHGVDTRASLATIVDAAMKQHDKQPFDGIILSGDLVNDDPPAYGLLYDYFSPFNVPVYCLPGNHDEARQLQQYLNQPPFLLPGVYTSDDWCLMTLDSSVPGQEGGSIELDSLEAALQKQTLPVLLVLHHPPLALGSRWLDNIGLENGPAFRALLEKYPTTKHVLFGHAHQAYDKMLAGIRYLCTPSTGAQFLSESDTFAIDKNAHPGYRWLNLQSDGTLNTDIVRVKAET